VSAPVAPLHAEPRVSSPQVSQALANHTLAVLEESDEWMRVRGADGYEGWLHRGYARLLPAEPPPGAGTFRRDFMPLVSLGARVMNGDGRRRALPLRAVLDRDERVELGAAVPQDDLPQVFPRDPEALIHSAAEYFAGTSYQWGGVTPWGADCSGFTQSIFALHGVALPRDAWQQAEVGTEAGTGIGALRPADLLFFSDRPDGRVTHVGIGLGDRRMAHVALGRGGFAVERLDDPDDGYVAKLRDRFLFARRVV
jgi:hypothetical protein